MQIAKAHLELGLRALLIAVIVAGTILFLASLTGCGAHAPQPLNPQFQTRSIEGTQRVILMQNGMYPDDTERATQYTRDLLYSNEGVVRVHVLDVNQVRADNDGTAYYAVSYRIERRYPMLALQTRHLQ